MQNLSIFFSNDSDLFEYEASCKGYRSDVYVEIDNSVYNVNVYTIVRLQQDFESEIQSYGFYTPDVNLILVKETNKEGIIKTIKKLYKQKYFEGIKPVEHIELSSLTKVK